MQKIIIINSKGGCGKTTIATNLASLYASSGIITTLMDHDPQGSSSRWLKLRPVDKAEIHAVDVCKRQAVHQTRAWHLRLPADTQRVIMDAPAGITAQGLVSMIQSVDTILIPVLPSPIDIHSATHFIKDLLLTGNVRQRGIRVGVVANRVRRNNLVYKSLERFLHSLQLPFVTTLRDTQNYVHAFERGIGIHEMWDRRVEQDKINWLPLLNWLEKRTPAHAVLRQKSS